jgi:transcription antitermination factor NusG
MAKPCPLRGAQSAEAFWSCEPVNLAQVEITRMGAVFQMTNANLCESAQQAWDHLRPEPDRKWFAVYTMPKSEHSVLRSLDYHQIESFLPTCEGTRLWKNRQRVTVVEPLFPSYVFARIRPAERSTVLQSRGALKIIGNQQLPSTISDSEIEFLRSDLCRKKVQPFREIAIGKKVQIRSGPMQGVQGILVEIRNRFRFILNVSLINQNAAVEVGADEVEVVLA